MPEDVFQQVAYLYFDTIVQIREKIRLALQEVDIESRPLWKPMHLQPIFEKCDNYVDGTSEDLFDRGLCVFPVVPTCRIGDLDRVIEVIKSNYDTTLLNQ